ncbi:MAG: mannose-1-phosphate guanylyltransferase [Muribaculaceae bacterium]|nr:mannose-1-phosphate guanylyltransferase [Muribaculaceae bacterium]
MTTTSIPENNPILNSRRQHRYCVIMCGGIGSRFWPYSREERPKQFLDFFGTGRSLLAMTVDRFLPIVPIENIIIVTNSRYAPLVAKQLPDLPAENILLEPARRNTAPCIAWASYHILARDPEASIVVAPSDHLIMREREFEQAITSGLDFVENQDALLTLGIKPTRPETGYGYIQVGQAVQGCNNILKVKTFTEKPDRDLARVFVESREFFWNSGIFIWRANTIVSALHRHAPEVAAVMEHGIGLFNTPAEKSFIDENFPSCQAISIDYAVMEKASNVYVECVDLGWSDLGTWGSLYEISPKNRDANVTQNCAVMAYNSTGNIFALPSDKLVVVDSLKDYIIADSGDVLLICPKSEEQRIKLMVNDVKAAHGDRYL